MSFTLLSTDRASAIPSNIYAVANPVRGLLNRKISEEHLQSSNESIDREKQEKNEIKKNKKRKCRKDLLGRIQRQTRREPLLLYIKRMHGDSIHARVQPKERLSLERVWYIASREPSEPPPLDCNYFAFAPKGITSTTCFSQCLRGNLNTSKQSIHPVRGGGGGGQSV